MENIYNQQKAFFIARNGQERFDKLYRKISESKTLSRLEGMSIHGGTPPNANDFSVVATSSSSTFFGFSSDSKIMGALIALKIWDEKINRVYGFASQYVIDGIAMNIVRINS